MNRIFLAVATALASLATFGIGPGVRDNISRGGLAPQRAVSRTIRRS